MKNPSVLLCLGIAAAALQPVDASAQAATVIRDQLSHGTANCQSALPVFDGNMRKRPLGMANEGAQTAFVTCDTESIPNAGTGFSTVAVGVVNRGTTAVEVTCTLVDGVLFFATYYPKTLPVAADGGTNLIQWLAGEDTTGANFGAPALSCALPPGVEIGLTQFAYPESTGAAP